MKTFAVLNQKGGTGKTTITINLAAQLASLGKRIVVADIDPQGNSSSASGISKTAPEAEGMYNTIGQGAAVKAQLIRCEKYGYQLLAANSALAGAEIELVQEGDWRPRLKNALAPLRGSCDYCFIDCPPSLGVLSVNALVAADYVLIPMQCEYFALEGLVDIVNTVRRLQEGINPKLSIAGIIRCMLDIRNRLARDVSLELEKHFKDKVFKTVIVRNVRVAEAPSHHQPVTAYAPASAGADCFRQLAEEFMAQFAKA